MGSGGQKRDLNQSLTSAFDGGTRFLPYIEEIRFPMYKALAADLTLNFPWPITALIGPNGTNKSSILRALSSAPEGRSLAEFWFSTEVDDIDAGGRGRASHRFIYKYVFDNSGTRAECRKYRGNKPYRSKVPAKLTGKRDPDYWEPTKRVDVDNMADVPAVGFDTMVSANRDRWNLIRKNVVYLDFRSEISAFDKYIHHSPLDRWVSEPSQRRFRVILNSALVARALRGDSVPTTHQKKLVARVRELDEPSVQAAARILGKPLRRVDMLEHKFFGPQGFTVRLHVGDATTGMSNAGRSVYSEAHAGSGEYAVVRLVDAIKRAPEGSLILLDEPEVSLHPGAQAALMEFIKSETLAKGHQVVIATHSPILVADLPPAAIKVLAFDSKSNRVVKIADACSPTEAFAHLGQTVFNSRRKILVEDDLAAELVRAALRVHAPTKLDTLEIVPFPGGSGGIVKTALASFAMSDMSEIGILLDGDQRVPGRGSALDVARAVGAAGDNFDALKAIWKSTFHEAVPDLPIDHGSDNDRNNRNKCKAVRTCIFWANDHLDFLPGTTPESLLSEALGYVPSGTDGKAAKQDWFERYRDEMRLTQSEQVSSADVLGYQKVKLAGLPQDSPHLKDVFGAVERIVSW
ncbi:ATP-binding protein [Nocardia canadensis]|uniref:ATP-binding protein n=1 Tax=Nocardia canadensis TaxID=3065238 RepID=UPI00292FEFA0|nr:AAA family ATPase [Nocardia canadensis]